jgi:putative heme-binding domain-containing protein
VNPSAEIRGGFETWVVTTDDGRVLTGFLVDQDKRSVSLRTQDGQTIRVNRDRIKEMQKTPRSLIPENLLKDLKEQELRDLFA